MGLSEPYEGAGYLDQVGWIGIHMCRNTRILKLSAAMNEAAYVCKRCQGFSVFVSVWMESMA